MYQNIHKRKQTEHFAGQSSPKRAKTSHTQEGRSVFNWDGSGVVPKQPFITLTKDFDTHSGGPTGAFPSFDIPEPRKRSQATSSKDDQRQQSNFQSVYRGWGERAAGGPQYASGTFTPHDSATTTPMSRWRSEAPMDAPYHAIASVANTQAAGHSRGSALG